MSEDKAPFKKWVYPVAAAGFMVFLLYLLFYGDIGSVTSTIGTANLGFYALAFCCVLGSIVCNMLAWKSMLSNLSVETKFRRIFNLSLVGTFVDVMVPGGWAGDIFKTYLLSKDQKGIGAKAAASMVMKNVIELLVTFAALVSGIVLLALNYTLEGGIILVLGTVMFLMALPLLIIIYLSTNLKATARVVGGFKRVSARLKGKPVEEAGMSLKLQNQLQEFHDGLQMMKVSPKAMVRPVTFQVLSWTFDVLTLFIIFASLGYVVGLDKVIITNTLVVSLQTQGLALIGLAQVVSSSVYVVLGISPFIAIASSLLAGFASFWFKVAVSFFAFQRTVFAKKLPIPIPSCPAIATEKLAEPCVSPKLSPATST
jgi:glycosyltransferase 2 family protein